MCRYGLLGPSGCGKTTLLSCLVGRRSLDSGEMVVLGGKPGSGGSGVPGPRVGYMPQELALYPEFTIAETVEYFGRIYKLEQSFVRDQLDCICKLLDLPPGDRRVKTLSGGQQRRVSFATAMFHDPELLILDEPTVGVDSQLRHRCIFTLWHSFYQRTVKRPASLQDLGPSNSFERARHDDHHYNSLHRRGPTGAHGNCYL